MEKFELRLGLQFKLTLVIGLFTLFLIGIIGTVIYYNARKNLEASSHETRSYIATNLASGVFNSVVQERFKEIIEMARSTLDIPDVAYVLVLNKENQVFYDSSQRQTGEILDDETTQSMKETANVARREVIFNGERVHEYSAPYMVSGQPWVSVRIGFSSHTINEQLAKFQKMFSILGGIGVFLALVISYWIARRLAKPILQIAKGALAIGAGDLDTKIQIKSKDEIGLLARTFNNMTVKLKDLYDKEREAKKQALGLAQEKQTLLESIGEGVYAVDKNFKVLFINKQGEELLGWKSEEIVGKNCYANVCKDIQRSFSTYIKSMFKSKTSLHLEGIIIGRKDGQLIKVNGNISPIIVNDKLSGAIVTFQKMFKAWGVIYDSITKKPLNLALVRIFDQEYDKLKETQVTDEEGRYGFLVDLGVYYITVDKPRYQSYKSKPIKMKKDYPFIGFDISLRSFKKENKNEDRGL